MTITHREGWMPNVVTQSVYHTLDEVYFLGWYGDPWASGLPDVVAVFRIKYKVS